MIFFILDTQTRTVSAFHIATKANSGFNRTDGKNSLPLFTWAKADCGKVTKVGMS